MKDFPLFVCSSCVNQNKKNCMFLKSKKEGTCHFVKCKNYKMKEVSKKGDYKIEGYFMYKILRSSRSSNEEEFTKYLQK